MPSSAFTKEETKAWSDEDTCPIAAAEIGPWQTCYTSVH